MAIVWHADAWVGAHTALLGLIDAAGAGAYVNVRDSSATVLSTLPLNNPCGTVNGTTGQLTLSIGARDEAAAAGGTAFDAILCDVGGKVWATASVSAGTAPVANTFVVSSLTVVAGAPFELLSATVG